jgi:apolipoprotein D and lipocalin family protein
MQIPAPHVDIPRYMGDWYVIASIPTALEKNAYNAIESYALDDDGSIQTTFTYRKGGFDGEPKKITARGFVKDSATNAVWGMRFIWPLQSDYRIAWIAEDYSQVVVARKKRDYVWIMARTPTVDPADLTKHKSFAQSLGYDPAKIQDVPQKPN